MTMFLGKKLHDYLWNVAYLDRKTSVGREERSSATHNSLPLSSPSAAPDVRQHDVIKIAIDMHGTLWVASRQLDNATPQPPQ